MASTIFDSALYRDVFSTPSMRAVFSDEAQHQGLCAGRDCARRRPGRNRRDPARGRAAIARQAPDDRAGYRQLKRDTENVGYPIVGLVRQLSERLGDAGRYLHWGATTQDIMDTATVLQLRDAVALIEAAAHRRHGGRSPASRDVIATRRWRAAPICSRRCRSRSATRPRSGCRRCSARPSASSRPSRACSRPSSAARPARWPRWRPAALEVRAAYARDLGLAEPDITWHVARDGLVEMVQTLGRDLRRARQDRLRRHDADGAPRSARSSSRSPRTAAPPRPCRRSAIRSRRKSCWPTRRCRATHAALMLDAHGAGSRARDRPVARRMAGAAAEPAC